MIGTSCLAACENDAFVAFNTKSDIGWELDGTVEEEFPAVIDGYDVGFYINTTTLSHDLIENFKVID